MTVRSCTNSWQLQLDLGGVAVLTTMVYRSLSTEMAWCQVVTVRDGEEEDDGHGKTLDDES